MTRGWKEKEEGRGEEMGSRRKREERKVRRSVSLQAGVKKKRKERKEEEDEIKRMRREPEIEGSRDRESRIAAAYST